MNRVKREKTLKNPTGKVATTIYLQPELLAALKQRSLEIGSPVAEIVRRAVVVYLQANGVELFAEIQQQSRGYRVEKSIKKG